jgi:hypothetical protein
MNGLIHPSSFILQKEPDMSDQLIIQNGKVLLTTEEGQRIERPESQLTEMLCREILPPLNGTAFPDGIKFVEWREPFLLVVHQLPPHVRLVRWIAADSPRQYGPGTKYRKVRLSIPYAITFAMYCQRGEGLFLAGNNELYFRNEPLRSKNDRLGYPALLNISRIPAAKRQRAWICTQFLRCTPDLDWTAQLRALLDHTWNGGFNLSSENHEGASWYTDSKGIHPSLHPVEKWEKATTANEAFALTVPWKPAPLAVGELIENLFEENQHGMADWLGRLLRSNKPKGIVSRFLNFAVKAASKG